MTSCTIINIDRCSLNDGPGIRTVIFFKGCNLRCMWCHNPETYTFKPQKYYENQDEKTYGYKTSVENIHKIIMKDIDFYHASGGGITLSGGEALLQIKAVEQIVQFCHKNDINVCIETSGAVPLSNIKRIEKYVDWWLYDYKLTDQNKYYEYLKATPSLTLSNLKYLIQENRNIILRCPVIHTINDNDEHFKAISILSTKVNKVEILPYHNLGKSKAEKIHLEHYFSIENTTQELKDKWKKQLTILGCKNFIIK